MPLKSYKQILTEFTAITGRAVELPDDYRQALASLCSHLATKELRPKRERRRRLIASINRKFSINRDAIAMVYAAAASKGGTFNYIEKTQIQWAFDYADPAPFNAALTGKSLADADRESLQSLFCPAPEAQTLEVFNREVDNPSKLRRDKGQRPIGREIQLAAVASFSFAFAEEEVLHEYYDECYDASAYDSSYWLQLRRMRPELYNRDRALDIVRVGETTAQHLGAYSTLRRCVLGVVRRSYEQLNNHGHLAIWIDPIQLEGRSVGWELALDTILFAEKHDEVRLKSVYFRHRQISKQTQSYIRGINARAADFSLANEGFTYRDTFVCSPSVDTKCGDESLLILLQKNKRDETLVPCPACRSHDVQGNSYPSLGVRSWECRNLLCPERSKYNRGKRYSFKALLMQEAIADPKNEIPAASVRRWSRDVLLGARFEDAFEMLVRHYSLYGDTVHLVGTDAGSEFLGRQLVCNERTQFISDAATDSFFESPWFHRYITERSPCTTDRSAGITPAWNTTNNAFSLINGSSSEELAQIPSCYFDAAVTSPPYYNAREYSSWDNIYCYLHDMRQVAAACHRTLKPGGIYLYNVFDYFDNENTVVFSAMGNKRLILSALTADIFRRVGFSLLGNVTWDKGEIEGKRGFNAGNFSPYYQSPFNCWEHVLVFCKAPVADAVLAIRRLPSVLRAKPVMKMVNGENTHGHSAPFPEEIPRLLRAITRKGSRVLDPYGGSGTTARGLAFDHASVVCIEKSTEYCELATRLFDVAERAYLSGRQLALFSGDGPA